jgi:death on curing protein
MTTIDPFDLEHLVSEDIQDIHDEILSVSEGLPGTRKGMTPDSLVGRIQSTLMYSSISDIAGIAALYAEVISKGHVFLDGNKRTAMTCMLTFLDINGYRLDSLGGNISLADKMVDVAESRINRDTMTAWLKPRLIKT